MGETHIREIQEGERSEDSHPNAKQNKLCHLCLLNTQKSYRKHIVLNLFNLLQKCESVYRSVLGQPCRMAQKLQCCDFSDTISVISVKLCMMVLLVELHLFIPLSVTVTTFNFTAVSNIFNF